MIKRTKRIADLGSGLRSRKAVDISLNPKHKGVEIEAVDIIPKIFYGEYLKARGVKSKPGTLNVRSRTHLVDFLKSKTSNYFDHLFAHFTLQHMSYADRQRAYAQTMRTLRPGTKFVTIEDVHYSKQLPIELRNAGFKVTVKQLSAKELLGLKTDNADMNANHAMQREQMERELAAYPPEMIRQMSRSKGWGNRDFEGVRMHDADQTRKVISEKFHRIEGKNSSRDANQALKRILRDVELIYKQKPFVLITATKPRN